MKAPVNKAVSQLVTATGTVELLRSSNGEPWRTYTASASERVGVDLNFRSIAFGYAGGSGAYFGAIAADGTLRTVGLNTWGQLGNGTFTQTLTPTTFTLTGTDRPVSVFTNLTSNGYNTFVLTDKGTVWGAGRNDTGQLGDGTKTNRPTPVRVNLPSSVAGKHVRPAGFDTYVLGSDNNLYATGKCASGLLGYSYTISGCSDQPIYKRVALPAPTSDPNRVPTTNIVSDVHTTCVRMQGGRVYCWGGNTFGQFGSGTTTAASMPTKVGTFGDSGQPRATRITTDGTSLWVLGSDGNVWGAGWNVVGQIAGEGIPIMAAIGKCLAASGTVGLETCSSSSSSQRWTFQEDGSIYLASLNKCLAPNLDGVTAQVATCDGTSSQKFTLRDDNTLFLRAKNKCLTNPNFDGVTIRFDTCGISFTQAFTLPNVTSLVRLALPAIAGRTVKIVTDELSVSVLTDNGQVWSAGANNSGQLGNGERASRQLYPVEFTLPNGVTARDVFTTAYAPTSDLRFNDTFVIGSDGKVYGSGSNAFGQFGDGTTADRSTPVAMWTIDGVNVKALSVESGGGTTIVLGDDHKIYTVGNNSNGQLGDGTTTNSSTPKANQFTNVLPVIIF